MSIEIWLTLLAASILISLSPGAGAVTAMSYGISHGPLRAQPAILGLISGYGVQFIVVAVGLGSLVATSMTLFNLIKWVGVAYLIWLGIQQWRQRGGLDLDSGPRAGGRKAFLQSLLINITNPKGMVFLVALVPQFLNPAEPQLVQMLVIGLTLTGVDWAVMTGYSLLSSRLRPLLKKEKAVRMQGRVTGSALIAAGLALSTASQR
ncbi:LysE family transporter [Marinobacterium jannaschii]|uniref:LysE family transporter n=1 Tax=Marinobacterium jannaschii TaxID=64970 RepID=UPI0004895248|nr:LysE family transporter [Marinobacterium jannaschii]